MGLEMHGIDIEELVPEFAGFRVDEKDIRHDSTPFVQSLTTPLPRFAERLLGLPDASADYADRVRGLYFFLLEKRYTQKLNLLYFAFDVFDESSLPDDVVSQTPFPHEDGVPKYGNALKPGFRI
ncbi:MAG: hypothetical protein ABFD97_18475 [Syntrophobacter sp.]